MWYCLCGSGQDAGLYCDVCGDKKNYMAWHCHKCKTVTVDASCPTCNITRAISLRNERVRRLLALPTSSGHPMIQLLHIRASSYAGIKNRPAYLIDDAVGQALEAIVKHVGKFDPSKGSFEAWAVTILRNTMATMAKKDSGIHSKDGVPLDAVDEDGTAIAEAIEGSVLNADMIIDLDTRSSKYKAMYTVADLALGDYKEFRNPANPFEVKRVITACFEEYVATRGVAWKTAVSNRTGIAPSALSKRFSRAKELWQTRSGSSHTGTGG